MKINIEELVRENIRNLKPYSSARKEFSGKADVLLDANENPYGSPLKKKYNRYPDPDQTRLKQVFAEVNNLSTDHIAIENGSDMMIDHICRVFCQPGKDNIIVLPPTFAMYEVAAHTNGNEVREVLLGNDFRMDAKEILKAVDGNTKVIFLCSPNNPTGNVMDRNEIKYLLDHFKGIIVLDEAYNNFSNQRSFVHELQDYNNLIVLQTLSKAWGLAGLRIGIAYSDPVIAGYLNKIKTPYNLSIASEEMAVKALGQSAMVNEWIKEIIAQRSLLADSLLAFDFVEKVYPSEANFLLIKVKDAQALYDYLLSQKIIVRNQSNKPLLTNCLRISIGTPEENKLLISALKKF